MKKSILNLGKALTKAEQRNVFGGTLTTINPDCDGAHDGNGHLGCRCGDGAACMANIWVGPGWIPRAGTCSGGECVTP